MGIISVIWFSAVNNITYKVKINMKDISYIYTDLPYIWIDRYSDRYEDERGSCSGWKKLQSHIKLFFKNINPVGKALKQVTVTHTRKTYLEI